MRVRTFVISPDLFLALFASGPHKGGYSVVENGIPEDAKLVNVRHGWPNSIELLIESEEFAEIADGQLIPQITPTCVANFSAEVGSA